MGSQRVGHDWVTSLSLSHWQRWNFPLCLLFYHKVKNAVNLNDNLRHFNLVLFQLSVKHIFSSVQLLSHVWFFVTPWTAAHQTSLYITNSQSLLKLISIKSVIPFNHLILWSSPSPPAFNIFQHHGLFQWIGSSHQVAEVLEFQFQNHVLQKWYCMGRCVNYLKSIRLGTKKSEVSSQHWSRCQRSLQCWSRAWLWGVRMEGQSHQSVSEEFLIY